MTLFINQWYLESQKPLVTLIMSQKMGKTSAIAKFQNLIGKAIFVCPGKRFTGYVPSCTRKKQNRLRSQMSVEIEVAYYITVEGPIGKIQMLLVFLFRL